MERKKEKPMNMETRRTEEETLNMATSRTEEETLNMAKRRNEEKTSNRTTERTEEEREKEETLNMATSRTKEEMRTEEETLNKATGTLLCGLCTTPCTSHLSVLLSFLIQVLLTYQKKNKATGRTGKEKEEDENFHSIPGQLDTVKHANGGLQTRRELSHQFDFNEHIKHFEDDLGILKATLEEALFSMENEFESQQADANSKDPQKLKEKLDKLHKEIEGTKNHVKNSFPEHYERASEEERKKEKTLNKTTGRTEMEKEKDENFQAILRQLDAIKRAIRGSPFLDGNQIRALNKHIENIEDDLGILKATLEEALFPMGTKLEHLTRRALEDHEKLQEDLDELHKEIKGTKKRVKTWFTEHYKRGSDSRSKDENKGHHFGDQRTSTTPWQEKLEEKILKSSAPAHLQASYDSLELQFKLCWLCLAAFPENQEVKKRVLIYWWIGEGLVSPKGEISAEEMGEECFQKLLDLGLIEPVYSKEIQKLLELGLIEPTEAQASKFVHGCKVHPWFRWMLVAIAKEATFFDLNSRGGPEVALSSYKSRRSCLVKSKQPFSSPSSIDENLLSLVNVDQNVIILKSEELAKLRKLVVLQLGRWQTSVRHHIEGDTDLFKGLESLRHLRYLNLRGISRITNLPESISQLGDLRILDLRACHNLEKLPSGITSLKKLTHLDVTECYLLDQLPKGMSSLSDLQVLKGFVFPSGTSKDACTFTELTKLEKLRKLSLNTGNIDTRGNDYLNGLTNLKNLRSLTISWGIAAPVKSQSTARQISTRQSQTKNLTGISAPSTNLPLPNLEKLDLRCFSGTQTPDLLVKGEFGKLKNLYISGGKLSNLALKSKLEVLRLKYLLDLESDWTVLKGGLPHLKCAQIVECPKLKSFPELIDGVWVNNAQALVKSTDTEQNKLRDI